MKPVDKISSNAFFDLIVKCVGHFSKFRPMSENSEKFSASFQNLPKFEFIGIGIYRNFSIFQILKFQGTLKSRTVGRQ